MSSAQIVGLLCFAAICINLTFAISCYECNSAQDKRCIGDANNHLSDDLKRPCPDKKDGKPFLLCRKIKQVIDFEVNGLPPDSRVIRTCGWDDSQHKNRCYQRSGFGGRQEVCACDQDGCNGSNMATVSFALVAGLVVLLQINRF